MANTQEMSFYYGDINTQRLEMLIAQKRNMELYGIDNMDIAVSRIEQIIEKQGFSCRIKTANRAAGIAVAAIPNPITAVIGIGTAIGIAAHNIATFNPDFEIIKNYVNNKITLHYKKM